MALHPNRPAGAIRRPIAVIPGPYGLARDVEPGTRVPLPFELPMLSRGLAALTPAACAAGERATKAASSALASLLGRDVAIRGRPVPGVPATRAAAARLTLDLAAIPAAAALEVEAALVVALVDMLAGGSGVCTGATALTPVEVSALELFVLAALEGAISVPEIASLAPRLSRDPCDPPGALAVELELAAGSVTGRGRLLIPPSALRALRIADDAAGPGAAIPVPLSARSGRAPLSSEELAALAPGDVVLLDRAPEVPDALVVPGGARVTGRIDGSAFHVEGIMVTSRNPELPIVLEVELARVEVPLAELARLEPGAALPLAIDRSGVVTLRIGERAIGRGELVDVDGTVGVRVLALEVAP